MTKNSGVQANSGGSIVSGVIVTGTGSATTGSLTVHGGKEIDYQQLAAQLKAVAEGLRQHESQDASGNSQSAEAIDQAVLAAEDKDESKLRKALSKAGAFAVEAAKDVGAPLALAAIKNAMGLPG